MKAIFKNKAFTLVELLIVIAIIGMLAVLSIAGYTSYRKNALSDLAVEGLIAKMHEMKESSIYGVNKTPQCFGLAFVEDSGDYKIGAFKQDFLTGQKQWSDSELKWVESGCHVSDAPGPGDADKFMTFDIDPMINVSSVVFYNSSATGAVDVGSFYVRFLPPNGELEVKADTGSWGVVPSGAKFVNIEIQYGEGNDSNYRRNLVIQLDGSGITYNNISTNVP